MPDIGNKEITGFDHFSVCFGDGKSGMHRRIKRIEGFIKAIWGGGIGAGVIGLDIDQTDMGIGCFGLSECVQGKTIEHTVISYEEFRHAVFVDVLLDGGKKVRVQVGGGIGVTEEEARFFTHIDHLDDC